MRLKYGVVLLMFLFFLAFGCEIEKKSESIQQTDQIKVRTDLCFESSAKALAIRSILQTEEFQKFLHPEVAGRLPILLVRNDFITTDLKIMSNGQQIQYRDSLELPHGTVHRINISNVDCNTHTFSYSVFYPIEGAIIQGHVSKINSKWVASVTHVGEKD